MIRRATSADIPAIQRLLGQILQVHHEARPDIFKGSGGKFTDEELELLLTDDTKPVFVYDNGKAVIGHLFLEIKEAKGAVLEPVKSLFIDDLCVDKDVRGGGIGQELYSFALAYAKEISCYHLTLNVWNDNVSALRFYQKQGMKPLHTEMEIIL
ncbi:N-acetyltransferase family protein [Streptococcus hillyeri]|uniref:GNAT family N-acetyltransferase n=1 Tax=Streptococcus hillyeri TaxID=2282420 RepID=A0A3L9DWL1_9STRE|nr:GNAT family N-acetyltransferase [Streptococcus hillyeri]RLY04724.1 GNAT family N-acetyltransferase [Streptococcus hillyeri]